MTQQVKLLLRLLWGVKNLSPEQNGIHMPCRGLVCQEHRTGDWHETGQSFIWGSCRIMVTMHGVLKWQYLTFLHTLDKFCWHLVPSQVGLCDSMNCRSTTFDRDIFLVKNTESHFFFQESSLFQGLIPSSTLAGRFHHRAKLGSSL